MTMQDPVADMLTRIRNAQSARSSDVRMIALVARTLFSNDGRMRGGCPQAGGDGSGVGGGVAG